jgi:hypothetical protein
MPNTLKAVRQCIQSHKLKAAFARVLKDCKLDEADMTERDRMLFSLGYAEGRAEQSGDDTRFVAEAMADIGSAK